MIKKAIMNQNKANRIISWLELKKATKIVVGKEECILLDWTQKEVDAYLQKGNKLFGAMSKNGFVLCNLHSLI